MSKKATTNGKCKSSTSKRRGNKSPSVDQFLKHLAPRCTLTQFVTQDFLRLKTKAPWLKSFVGIPFSSSLRQTIQRNRALNAQCNPWRDLHPEMIATQESMVNEFSQVLFHVRIDLASRMHSSSLSTDQVYRQWFDQMWVSEKDRVLEPPHFCGLALPHELLLLLIDNIIDADSLPFSPSPEQFFAAFIQPLLEAGILHQSQLDLIGELEIRLQQLCRLRGYETRPPRTAPAWTTALSMIDTICQMIIESSASGDFFRWLQPWELYVTLLRTSQPPFSAESGFHPCFFTDYQQVVKVFRSLPLLFGCLTSKVTPSRFQRRHLVQTVANVVSQLIGPSLIPKEILLQSSHEFWTLFAWDRDFCCLPFALDQAGCFIETCK